MQRRAVAMRPAWAASVLLAGALIACFNARAQDSSGTRAIPTYESVGLYWSNPGASSANGCEVKFRKSGESSWTKGLNLWFDARNGECRGSLVHLAPGTQYEVQMGLPGGGVAKSLAFTTWANQFPVARTVNVGGGSATLNVTEGGSASGYVVYDGQGATLDAGNNAQYNVTINASYVILRNFVLKGAKQDAIRIAANVTDVVIEGNEVSGWGRTRDGTWGADMDSGIRAVCTSPTMQRLTVQRNKIHSPRYSANSWSDGHPAGPQAITISYCGGNHVIRHNEMYSANGNYFNDVIGGEDNFSDTGFPNVDTDIYANRLSHAWDDAIEAEGGNRNVRIWGNYIDRTATGVATTVTAIGPVYVFRNVFNRNKFFEKKASDADDRQPFFKSGSDSSLGDGRRYLFHNTMLQAQESGSSYGLGGGAGIGGTGSSQPINNTVSMNNIYHLWKPNGALYQVGSNNAFQNDMFNGSYGAAIVNGINATPTYASGNGWQSESGGLYALAAGTPGYDQGVRIPNFNDAYAGAAPDVGAAEAGLGAMQFGVSAATASTPSSAPSAPSAPAIPATLASNGAMRANGGASMTVALGSHVSPTAIVPSAPTTPTAPTSPPPTNPTPTTPAPSGPTPISTTLDSSSYTISAGQSVTFTARIITASAAATGTVRFTANDSTISGCAAAQVADGTALCTTSSLAVASHAIRGVYSGDPNNSAGVAGPITQTVK